MTMAEMNFDHFDAGAAPRQMQISRLVNIAGATCSIALVIGLGVWGYKLAVRDVNGVPVIRAQAGAMREMPVAPGGEQASHQGLSVNAVAAVGMAASMPDKVLLAPAPVGLAAEDAAGLTGAAPVSKDQFATGPSLIEPLDASDQIGNFGTDAAVALALADALAEGAEPTVDLVAAPSLRPKPRPAVFSDTSAAETTPTADARATPAEIDPATLKIGTRLVQLGAFDDAAGARAEWARLQAFFGERMADKSVVIQAAQSGGRTFYRLRAHGFADEDAARAFCTHLVAENATCIPALHR